MKQSIVLAVALVALLVSAVSSYLAYAGSQRVARELTMRDAELASARGEVDRVFAIALLPLPRAARFRLLDAAPIGSAEAARLEKLIDTAAAIEYPAEPGATCAAWEVGPMSVVSRGLDLKQAKKVGGHLELGDYWWFLAPDDDGAPGPFRQCPKEPNNKPLLCEGAVVVNVPVQDPSGRDVVLGRAENKSYSPFYVMLRTTYSVAKYEQPER